MKFLTRFFGQNGRFVFSTVLVFSLFSSATVAGNLEQGVTDPPVVSPTRLGSDVSAFYVGLSGAYASGGTDRFGFRTPTDLFAIGELDLSGGYGGIRGGWRGVLPSIGGRDYVYGFELGYDFGKIDDEVSTEVGAVTVTGGSEVSDILSLRFRNGLTNKSGTVLYFVSVGYVQGDVTTTSSLASFGTLQSFEDSDSRDGYSVSIGAEHSLNDNWSITGEFEYVQFDSRDVDFGNGFSTKSTPRYRGVRFGLNYTF
ncbi:Opacity protein antigens [Ruegeria denitrificans]|uniref:Opacity protein antigens n=1 Tax=Ruegeria denitrificans TaxID=1715692 RepID=A0A0N7MAK1_9RHOB|nr:outer membrane beta-barrel protein [Ruegeria denitrificans]CUK12775.1 Opacity protein antigens [Ruegeria denitrificans]